MLYMFINTYIRDVYPALSDYLLQSFVFKALRVRASTTSM